LKDARAMIFGANALLKNIVYHARRIKVGMEQEIGVGV
jgi:hypothetical protein